MAAWIRPCGKTFMKIHFRLSHGIKLKGDNRLQFDEIPLQGNKLDVTNQRVHVTTFVKTESDNNSPKKAETKPQPDDQKPMFDSTVWHDEENHKGVCSLKRFRLNVAGGRLEWCLQRGARRGVLNKANVT